MSNPVTQEYEAIAAEQDAQERATRPSALAHIAMQTSTQLARVTLDRNALLTGLALALELLEHIAPLMDAEKSAPLLRAIIKLRALEAAVKS